MGKPIKYHINGTKIDLSSQRDLARYFKTTIYAVRAAEQRGIEDGHRSFWLTMKGRYEKNYRVKRIEND